MELSGATLYHVIIISSLEILCSVYTLCKWSEMKVSLNVSAMELRVNLCMYKLI